MSGLLLTAVLGAAAVVGPNPAAQLPSPPSISAPLADEELARLRGGYLVAGGLTLDFGAMTRTLVDGRLALQTQVTWTPSGAQVVQTADGQGAADPSAALAAAGVKPGDLGVAAYVTADGRSAVIQRVTAEGLANVVLNTASGRAISQNTDVTLTLPGFQAVQSRMSDALAASRMAQAITDAALTAAVHR